MNQINSLSSYKDYLKNNSVNKNGADFISIKNVEKMIEKEKYFLELNKEYDSRHYVIITNYDNDIQKFIIKRR